MIIQLRDIVRMYALTLTVTEEEVISCYFAGFSEDFFQYCDRELLKINTFFSGMTLMSLMTFWADMSQHVQNVWSKEVLRFSLRTLHSHICCMFVFYFIETWMVNLVSSFRYNLLVILSMVIGLSNIHSINLSFGVHSVCRISLLHILSLTNHEHRILQDELCVIDCQCDII